MAHLLVLFDTSCQRAYMIMIFLSLFISIPPDMYVKYWAYMIYTSKLVGTFGFGIFLAIKDEVEVAVDWVLAFICKNVGFTCLYSIFHLWAMYGMWQLYLFSDICQICIQCSLLKGWCQCPCAGILYVYTSPIYVYHIFGIYGIKCPISTIITLLCKCNIITLM